MGNSKLILVTALTGVVFLTLVLITVFLVVKENQEPLNTRTGLLLSPLSNLMPTSRPSPTPTVVLLPIQEAKVLAGGSHLFQTFNNCGPAVLSMALSYYGIDVSQQTLGKELRPHQH